MQELFADELENYSQRKKSGVKEEKIEDVLLHKLMKRFKLRPPRLLGLGGGGGGGGGFAERHRYGAISRLLSGSAIDAC